MTDTQVFPRAPITEAVVEFQLRLKGDAHLGRLALLHEVLKVRYPTRRDSWSVGGTIQFGLGSEAPSTSNQTKQTGYSFASADGRQVMHARLNAYGFSRLKPYEAWKPFRREAMDLWEHYRRIALPDHVTRVGLRYINRVELPLPMKDFKEYILTTPEIAPGLPDAMAGFVMQVIIPDPASGATVLINETIEPTATNAGVLSLIFDIDASKAVALPADSPDLWTLVEQLRNLKNEFFNKSFTDRAKELFR